MKLALLGFVVRRARKNLFHLFWTHALTSGTVAMTLFVFGAFIVVEVNLEHLFKSWGKQIQLTAYLDKNLDPDAVQDLLRRIESLPQVDRVRHISQKQAWRDFQTALGAQSNLLEGLPTDVLPASMEISLKPSQRDGAVVEQVARWLKQEKTITMVEYPQEWVERLGLIVLAVEWAKWIFGGVLFLTTFFIVSTTIKLAIMARRDEVEIMQLVGASEELIQAPFVLEGMVQGFVGAAISIGLLWVGYVSLRNEMPSLGGFLAPLGDLQFLDLRNILLLLAIGWLLGAAASVISLRRFVKRWKTSRGAR